MTKKRKRKKAAKKTRSFKTSTETLTQRKAKTWKVFSRFIRMRDAIRTTGTVHRCRCLTCGRYYPTIKMQAGHFVPGRCDAVLFSEKGVNAQCYRCNMILQGQWPAYYRAMQRMYGQEWIEEHIDAWERDEVTLTDEKLESLERFYEMKLKNVEAST